MMVRHTTFSRRRFLAASTLSLAAAALPAAASESPQPEPVIDIHQHTNYHDRSDADLVAHQKALGVTQTILLPAGRLYGLDAKCGGNDTVQAVAHDHPKDYFFFANEVTDLPEAREVIETNLKRGARGIGEQKFRIECDSKYMDMIAGLAVDFEVPILLHFMHDTYNTGIERFHKTLEKYPRVNFIGHAQTWWGNIDKNHDQKVMYPTGKVTPGGITDRLLSDYPNMYGDHSAHSGLVAMIRDEDHAREFIKRHQDKLMFGSDCADILGRGPGCTGAQILAAIRRLAPDKQAGRKILYGNAKRLLRL